MFSLDLGILGEFNEALHTVLDERFSLDGICFEGYDGFAEGFFFSENVFSNFFCRVPI